MAATIRSFTPADLETLRAVMRTPGLADQFDIFTDDGALEQMLTDVHFPASCIRLAFDGEQAIGFGAAFVLANPATGWSMVRVGVMPAHRRQGIGRRLLDAVMEAVRAHPDAANIHELASSAFMPNPAAEAFAAGLELAHDRWYWLMTRPERGIAPPHWPADIVTRVFDGSDAMLKEWTDCYNDSFARHHRYVVSPVAEARRVASGPRFHADGLLLAYRTGRCVGFVYNALHEARGEVATLGVAHEARQIGLGRALLRWGVQWIEANATTPVSLLVDGDNENALGLYRSEGFEITRTRHVWARRWEPTRA